MAQPTLPKKSGAGKKGVPPTGVPPVGDFVKRFSIPKITFAWPKVRNPFAKKPPPDPNAPPIKAAPWSKRLRANLIIASIGFLGMTSLVGGVRLSTWLHHYRTRQIIPPIAQSQEEAISPQSILPVPPRLDPKKPTVIVALSNAGTDLHGVLGPYEILSESGLFNVVTAAPLRQLSPTSESLAIMPDYSFEEAPPADAILIPAHRDPRNLALIDWIGTRSEKTKLVLAMGRGVETLARAGLLKERTALEPAGLSGELRGLPTNWVQGMRYLRDGRFVTSGTYASAYDAVFYVIEKLHSQEAAKKVADAMGWQWHRETDPSGPAVSKRKRKELIASGKKSADRPPLLQLASLIMHGAFTADTLSLGVLVYPGISELSLAAFLETLPMGFTAQTWTLSSRRELISTRHGLRVAAYTDVAGATRPDLLLIPSWGWPARALPSTGLNRSAPTLLEPSKDVTLHTWITEKSVLAKSYLYEPYGKAYEQSLLLVEGWDGGSASGTVARILDWTWAPTSGFTYWKPWLAFFVWGFIGAVCALGVAAVVRGR